MSIQRTIPCALLFLITVYSNRLAEDMEGMEDIQVTMDLVLDMLLLVTVTGLEANNSSNNNRQEVDMGEDWEVRKRANSSS